MCDPGGVEWFVIHSFFYKYVMPPASVTCIFLFLFFNPAGWYVYTNIFKGALALKSS